MQPMACVSHPFRPTQLLLSRTGSDTNENIKHLLPSDANPYNPDRDLCASWTLLICVEDSIRSGGGANFGP